jgi:hypothetical protein
MVVALSEDIELLPLNFGETTDCDVAHAGMRQFGLHVTVMWKLLIAICV